MFAIEVSLLTGRYVATAFDDRARAEWPPHPARLFSALVAAHFESIERAPEERAALEWLEALGAPRITASEAAEREVVTVFVPVNDTSVVASLDDEEALVDDARAAAEVARLEGGKSAAAGEKKLAKAIVRLADATKKAIAAVPSGKEGKDGPPRAASLLPERREKQPRTFPSVAPEDARIVFAWPGATPSTERTAVLDRLADRVVRLGHSSSLVAARVREDAPPPTWIPDEIGEVREGSYERTLRVVAAGQVDALCRAFSLQADSPGRVMPAVFQRYVRPDEARPGATAGERVR